MAFKDIKNNFVQRETELQSVVKNALNQLLQKEVDISVEINDVPNVTEALAVEKFPAVIFFFTSGPESNRRQHLFVLEPDFVARFYAWMIADEPAEKVGEEQFEGLKEAFQQVFGQIKLTVADNQASYALSELQVKLVENSDPLQEILSGKEAVHAVYQVSVEDAKASVSYYYWAISEEQPSAAKRTGTVQDEETITVQPAEFDNLGGMGVEADTPRNVDMLLDVNLNIVVELDRKVMLVSELLKMGKGSIIELEKSAGEPLDILINGRKFAEGEVVVIDDKFGIRITQLLSPRDRIKSLG